MRFITFSASNAKQLDNKVNEFLRTNPSVEISKMKFSASIKGVFVAFLYK